MKTRIFIMGFVLSLTILGCSKDNNDSPVTVENAKASSKIDAMSDDVSYIIEEQESNTYANSTDGKMADSSNSIFGTSTKDNFSSSVSL